MLSTAGPFLLSFVAVDVGVDFGPVPDEFSLSYLAWGILARIFAGDNEVKSLEQAQFCTQQYMEGITLGRVITDELAMA